MIRSCIELLPGPVSRTGPGQQFGLVSSEKRDRKGKPLSRADSTSPGWTPVANP